MRRLLGLLIAVTSCTLPSDRHPACGNSVFEHGVIRGTVIPVNLLFVVDSTPAMAPHITRLRAAMPAIFDALTQSPWPYALPRYNDLNIAVISSDLGAGSPAGFGCSEAGGDGVLRAAPDCDPSTPSFIWHYVGYHDRATTLAQLDCQIARLGPAAGGCELAQPLEAAWKARSAQRSVENGGFLRPSRSADNAVIIITNQDDCSALDPNALRSDPLTGPVTACLAHPERLAPLERYLEALAAPSAHTSLLGVVAGIPPELLSTERRGSLDFGQTPTRDAFIAELLLDPRLRPRTSAESEPSCTAAGAPAYPPTRLLQLVNGSKFLSGLGSLCAEDLATSVVQSLLMPHYKELGDPCLRLKVARAADGLLPCDMTWELPETKEAWRPLTPISCDERPDILSVPPAGAPQKSASGRTLCRVRQVPIVNALEPPPPEAGDGFYLDNAVGVVKRCFRGSTRVSYTAGAMPPEGVKDTLRCHQLQPRHLNPLRGNGSASIGDTCDLSRSNAGNGVTEGDTLCAAHALSGEPEDMFCHPQQRVCVRGCASDADCPRGWECDPGRTPFSSSAGRAICMNPSCGNDL